jgi:hypothetical protein
MPDDPTPLGDAMTHRFTQQRIPEPKPGSRATDDRANTDIKKRPGLPEHPVRMAADMEEDEADRADTTRPLNKGDVKSLKKQQG